MAVTACEADLAAAEQLTTRLCHDMAGLCGTLLGVLELAVEDAGSVTEALPLAHEMAAALTARLRLLRAAWGAPGEALDATALAVLAHGLPGAPKLRLDVAGLHATPALPPVLARLTLNAVLLGAEALPGGGTVTLSRHDADLVIAIAGRRPGWPPNLAGLLEQPQQALSALREAGPRRLQAPLLVALAQAAGIGLQLVPAADAAAASLRIAGAMHG